MGAVYCDLVGVSEVVDVKSSSGHFWSSLISKTLSSLVTEKCLRLWLSSGTITISSPYSRKKLNVLTIDPIPLLSRSALVRSMATTNLLVGGKLSPWRLHQPPTEKTAVAGCGVSRRRCIVPESSPGRSWCYWLLLDLLRDIAWLSP